MPKVYIASKFKHGERWKKLYEDSLYYEHPWHGIKFTSRWFKNYAGTIPDEPQFCRIGWEHDIEDIVCADALIIYVEENEKLRGALVEAGAALAYGRYVIIIGNHPDYGTWQHHANVHKVENMDAALMLLRCIDFPREE